MLDEIFQPDICFEIWHMFFRIRKLNAFWNMANFEGLHWKISSSINLLFLKSAIIDPASALTIQGDPQPTTEFPQSPYILKSFVVLGKKVTICLLYSIFWWISIFSYSTIGNGWPCTIFGWWTCCVKTYVVPLLPSTHLETLIILHVFKIISVFVM